MSTYRVMSTAIGISLALYEAYRYDEDGNLLTPSLGDYGPPTAMDMPEIEVHLAHRRHM